jgi:hypothetical protein
VRTWRRPLALLFAFGCVVSAFATGRFTVRLVADGMVSFAFVPIFEIAALALVWRSGRNRARPAFGVAVDRFFGGYQPWLIWMAILAGVLVVVPDRALAPVIRPAILLSVVPLLWSLAVDLRYFRNVMPRAAGGAWRDLALHRALSWTAILTYFLGIAIWHEYVPQVIPWIGR